MTLRDRETLLRRIRQVRRAVARREENERDGAPAEPGAAAEPADRVRELEQRVAHLEHLLEGLQDSVHREFERRDALIEKLQREIQPGALGAALAEDARRRGI